jgi:hypothetical protein
VPSNLPDLVESQDPRQELCEQSAAALAENGGEKSLHFETLRKSQQLQLPFPEHEIISFCRGLAMSARVTYPLKLGALELQLSPFRPSDEDIRRSDDLIDRTKVTGATDRAKVFADQAAIAALVMDFLLKSASPNHPDLTRDQLEEELDPANLTDAISALRGMSLRQIAQHAPWLMVH